MKYRVLVIDDDKNILNKIAQIFSDFYSNYIELIPMEFDSVVNENIQKADLYILEIAMPDEINKQGFILAKHLEDTYPNSYIIFCSNHNELVFESFKLNTFYFVRKQNLLADLKLAMKKFFGYKEKENIVLFNEKRGLLYTLRYKDIISVNSFGKEAIIKTINNKTYFYDKMLGNVYTYLPHTDFLKISRECIINVSSITEIRGEKILLKDGENIHIPHGKIREIKNEIKKMLQQK